MLLKSVELLFCTLISSRYRYFKLNVTTSHVYFTRLFVLSKSLSVHFHIDGNLCKNR